MKLIIKSTNFSFLFMICVLITISSGCVASPNRIPKAKEELRLNLSLDKVDYPPDDPIQVTFELINSGTDTLLVNKRMALNVSFAPKEFMDIYCMITDPSGQPVEFSAYVSVVSLRPRHFALLNVNETTKVVYGDIRDLYDFSKPGKYTIQAIYENQFDPANGSIAWKGKITSNTVTINIRYKQ